MNKQSGFTSIDMIKVAVLLFILAAIGGWIANIVKLVGMIGGDVTAMFIARCVGIFAAPLGAVLGFF